MIGEKPATLALLRARSFGARIGAGLAFSEAVVDCWIGTTEEVDRRVVRVAGRLTIDQIPALLMACSEGRRLGIEVDLTELQSSDAAGIEALQRVRRAGATLVGAPGYIQLKLDSPGPDAAGPPAARGHTRH